jgi:diguanylate cyclase (GGDEF)-like protein/PAS domain S-box-containing protein
MRALFFMRSRSALVTIAVTAVVYVCAAKFGFTMAFTAEQVTLVWPPTGFALAILLGYGTGAWPGVFIGAFLANATAHEPLAIAACIATGNTLEAVVGAYLLRRYTGLGDSLDRLRHALGLVVFGALAGTTISATIGVASLCVAAIQPWTAYGQLWWTWWLGDAAGALLIAPALLTLGAWTRLRREGRVAEAAVLLAGLLTVSVMVFAGPFAVRVHYPLEYTVFPFLIWAAIRFGVPGAAMANALTSGIAVWGTVHGFGPYGVGEVSERLMLLQIFMGIVAGTGLLLGAAVSERDAAARRRRMEHGITQVLADASDAAAATLRILEVICLHMEWEVGLLWSLDRETQHLRCADIWRQPSVRIPSFERICRSKSFAIGVGLPGRVWASESPSWLVDIQNDPNYPRLGTAAEEGLHGAFAFPITVSGDVLGVFEFFGRSVRRPDADLLQMFATIGAEVGQFLTRKQVEQDVAESEARKAGILEAVLDCIMTIDHRGRIVEFNPAAERTFGYRRADVVGREMAQLIIPAALRAAHREGMARYLAAGVGGAIDRRFETTAMRADGTEFPVELSITRIPSAGPPMFTGFLRDITVQKRMLEQLSYRAAHDGLTQSLNRTAFMDRLRAAVSRTHEGEQSIAVLFVDIDQFKAINDRFGHVVGDQLLVAVAGRLHACVRPTDTVARLGGDEFAILVENVTDHADVTAVAERIKQALHTPFNLDGVAVAAAASLGVAFGSSENLPEDLLREADEEMYRAKAIGQHAHW